MELKKLRLEKGLTQEKVAKILGVSRRTYVSYEKNESKIPPMKMEFFLHTLEKYGFIDETHGVLTLDTIKQTCNNVFKEYDVEYAYLFGSYAKGCAKPTSDIDLVVTTSLKGLAFYGLAQDLEELFNREIDLIRDTSIIKDSKVDLEIRKTGIVIYERQKFNKNS